MDYRDYLEHYGVLGMHWGVRKSYNELSKRKQKKIDKKYKKLAVKGTQDLARSESHRRLEAYNEAADYMNEKGIKDFHKTNSEKDKNYMDKYEKYFEKVFSKKYDKITADYIDNNKHYKKAEELIQQYSLTKYNDLAKKNTLFLKDLKTIGSQKMLKNPSKYE